ncbi:MAG: hypothetical protein U1E65_11600 [Myxococcota bacterium]
MTRLPEKPRALRRFLLVSSAAALLVSGCLDAYVPPPGLAALDLSDGTFDPLKGALSVAIDGLIDPSTLDVSVLVERRGLEGDLCLAGAPLPQGCAAEATPALLHCRADPAKAERADTGVRYPCQDGGALELALDNKTLRFLPITHFIPYERYVIHFEPGLSDQSGHRHGVAVELNFHVAGDLARAPTDFKPGVFFAIVDTQVPIPAQLQFWFYLAVRPETGEVRIFGADVDPKDMATDPKTNRIPNDWYLDPNPPTGSSIRASGQVAESTDGRILHVYPFHLQTVVPPVEVVGMELSGRFRVGRMPGGPSEDRELMEASMTAPQVYLGLDNERAALGAGRGVVTMMRLTSTETPSLPDMLPTGAPASDILEPFAGQ